MGPVEIKKQTTQNNKVYLKQIITTQYPRILDLNRHLKNAADLT